MFKRINIVLYFLLLFTFDLSTAQENFKVFVPEYVISNGNFEVSIITSKKFSDAEKLNLYLLPDISLTIDKIELWTQDKKMRLPLHSEYVNVLSNQYQKVSIDLSDTSLFENDIYFQFVIYLKSSRVSSNNLKFFGDFVNGDDLLGKLISSDEKVISGEADEYELTFIYYEKYATPELAAVLTRDAYLNIPLVYDFKEVLALEFWLKAKNFNSTFLEIINWETNWIEYTLSINENQMLVVNSKSNEFYLINPYFISQNIWYHIYLNLNKISNELSVLINGEEVARIKIRNTLDMDNLVMHFLNEEPSGEIYIEQLRLIDITNSSSAIFRNRNYSDYSDDSSRVIFQMNFTDTELSNLLNNKTISYERIRLIKSDAPIYPRAPMVDVKLMNNYYEIEWKGGSYQNVDYYVLEKAIGNSDFIEAGKKAANNTEAISYQLISEKNDETEIVYFRIRQVNIDGSIVYSEVVKVGQGLVDDVIIGQNYPNPFNPTTMIEFDLLQDTDVEVIVYNLAGKEIAIIHSGYLASGGHHFKFDATGLPSGIYLYQIKTRLSSQTKKMILAK